MTKNDLRKMAKALGALFLLVLFYYFIAAVFLVCLMVAVPVVCLIVFPYWYITEELAYWRREKPNGFTPPQAMPPAPAPAWVKTQADSED